MSSKLIIGDSNSIFIKSLIENLKKYYPESRVDCLSTTKPSRPIERVDYLYENKISYWWSKRIGRLGSIGWLLGIVVWFFFRTNRIKYDCIQIHFVGPMHALPFIFYKKSCSRVASILWGSDVFRCTMKSWIKWILAKSDLINCTTDEIYKAVVDILGENNTKKKTITRNVFGLEPLEEIKTLLNRKKREDMLTLLEIEGSRKKIVVVGHNASKGQQHIEIIASLSRYQFDQVLFIFPMTYGGDSEYKSKVINCLKQSRLNFVIKDKYMSNHEVAALRLVCDVFIQLQITDGLSGSMQEHLYAKNIVITGEWLPYSTLSRLGVSLVKIKSVDCVGETLLSELHHPSISQQAREKNHLEIYNLSGWENVIDAWHNT
jgi:hypothetical protein